MDAPFRNFGKHPDFLSLYDALNVGFISGELGVPEGYSLPRLYNGPLIASVAHSPGQERLMGAVGAELEGLLYNTLGFSKAKLRMNGKKYHHEGNFSWMEGKVLDFLASGDKDMLVFPYSCPFTPEDYRAGTNDRGPCITSVMVTVRTRYKSAVDIRFEVHFRASEVTSRLLPDMILISSWMDRLLSLAISHESGRPRPREIILGPSTFFFSSIYQSMYLVQCLWERLGFDAKTEWDWELESEPHASYNRHVREIFTKLQAVANGDHSAINLKRKYTPVRRTYQHVYKMLCESRGVKPDPTLLGKP